MPNQNSFGNSAQDQTMLIYKLVIQDFVMCDLQKYYDRRIIETKDEFKKLAESFTYDFSKQLFRNDYTLTIEDEKYISDCIKRRLGH